MRLAALSVCVLVFAAGCVSGGGALPAVDGSAGTATETVQTPGQPTTPSSSLYDVDVGRIEDLIHEGMNERRRQNGVEPLSRNESLDGIARYKSWDMAQRDYFAHTGPNGTIHGVIRDRYGARCRYTGQNLHLKRFNKRNTYIQTQLSDSEQVASDTVGGLLNSSGHRENALSPNYDSQGIGVFVDENGSVFVTQELCG